MARSPRARGLAIPLVVIFLMFAGALAFALQQVMVQQRAQGVLSSQKLIAQSLAFSAVALIGARLEATLAIETSALAQQLAQAGTFASPTDVSGMLDLDPGLAALKASVPWSNVKAVVTLGNARPLIQSMPAAVVEGAFGADPLERRLDLKVTVDTSFGLATVHRELVREVRHQSPAPGAFGKFTLWADQLVPENGNTVESDFVGNALDAAQPLVLHNEGTTPEANAPTDRNTYQQRGYVYLGGTPTLNLTGGFANLGELFTFLKPGDLTADPPVRVPAILRQGLPAFFGQSYPHSADGTTQSYKVISMVYGFFTGPDARGRTMQSFLPSMTAPLAAGLHLFGTFDSPCPTLVLGEVSRAYCLATGIVLAVAGGTPSGSAALVSLLPDLGRPSGFPAGAPAILNPAEGLPGGPFDGLTVDLVPVTISLTTMFPTGPEYDAVASSIVVEPYTSGYNHFYRADDAATSFTPTDPVFTGHQDQFELPASGPVKIFRGPASGLGRIKTNPDDPAGGIAPILRERAVYRVATIEQLFDVFKVADELFLGAPVLVDRPADLVNLGDVIVGKGGGGAIVLDSRGKTTPSSFAVKSVVSRDTGQGLMLCPLNGDAQVDFAAAGAGSPYPLSVIAPAGQLKPTGVVSLEGSLVVRKLDLGDTEGGGDLYHDPRLDPTSSVHAETYRTYVSDDETSW